MRFDGLTHRLRNTTALRLLPKLPMMLTSTEALRVDQRGLGQVLGVSQPSISRGLLALVAVGAIIREGRGPGSRYRLSRDVDWPGVEPASFHNAGYGLLTGPDSFTPPPRQQEPCQHRPAPRRRHALRSTAWSPPSP